ncbi:MAG: DUF92 domain-containing protein [Oscillospiraceae bacterium]|nr:DUF92 domain-containing protein [Oscillospiraceae bacterium]
MVTELLGIGLSFALVFAILGLAGFLKNRGVGGEVCRKMVHILLGNWIILAVLFFRSLHLVLIVPGCFVALNYLSYRKGTFGGIEREEGNTPGAVWYAVSLFLLCLAGWSLDQPLIAAAGILAMGYGDGLAALIGIRWGRRPFPTPYSGKTLEGSFAVLIFAGASVGIVFAVFAPHLAIVAAISGGAVAMAAELYSSGGLDNLTLPLSVGGVAALLVFFPEQAGLALALAATLLILIPAFHAGSLALSGLHSATLVGVSLYALGGWVSFLALGAFFFLGSLASRIGKSRKISAYALHKRVGSRGAVQVFANAGPAICLAAIYAFSGRDAFLLGVIASFSAAAADTFASEIGMLSKSDPVSIFGFRKLARGLSGGVTFLGLLAGTVGAGAVALLALPAFGWRGFLIAAVFGLAGCLLDSLLGAALQAKYALPGGGLTERPAQDGQSLPLLKGVGWVNNDLVNFVCPLISGVLASLIAGGLL